MDEFWTILSTIIGYIYVACWTLSFYPQTILNYRRKSVTGFSFDFTVWNTHGNGFYSIYNISKYIMQHKLGVTESVGLNDILFAVHGFLMMCYQLYQCYLYGKPGELRLSKWHARLLGALWLLLSVHCILGLAGVLPFYSHNPPGASSAYPAYSVLEFMGFSKVFISFIKNVPQVYLNYRLKSTVGWSTLQVNLDIAGSLLSFLQQFIDAVNQSDMSIFTSNVPKLLLALESLAFDTTYLIQRFALYPPRKRADEDQPDSPGTQSDKDSASSNCSSSNHHSDYAEQGHAGQERPDHEIPASEDSDSVPLDSHDLRSQVTHHTGNAHREDMMETKVLPAGGRSDSDYGTV